MLHKRLIPSTIVIMALAVPGAAFATQGSDVTASGDDTSSAPVVQSQDLRSPDARDAAAAPASTGAVQDLRSPDARDAAGAPASTGSVQDLRSPDARDAAVATGSLAGTTAPDTAVSAVEPVVTDDGFEWGSAAIGAAAVLAIVLAVAAAAALIVPRRRMRSPLTH